jgi:hypothetical protein
MIDWCCLGFQSNYQNKQPGKRGFSIIIGRDSCDQLEVVIQFRSIDIGMETSMPNTQIPITLCTDLRIVFCPWCGTNIMIHYEKWADLLMRPGFRIVIPKE